MNVLCLSASTQCFLLCHKTPTTMITSHLLIIHWSKPFWINNASPYPGFWRFWSWLRFYSTSSSLSVTTEYLSIVGLSSKKLQLLKNISKELWKESNIKVNLLKKLISIMFEKRHRRCKKGLKKASKSRIRNIRKAMFGSNWTPQGMSWYKSSNLKQWCKSLLSRQLIPIMSFIIELMNRRIIKFSHEIQKYFNKTNQHRTW